MPTTTGAKADHRLPLKPSQIETLARALAADLGVAGVTRGAALPAEAQAWLTAVRNDLTAHRGSSIVVAGEGQPPVVHALAHAMNAALGNGGQTVLYTDPIEAHPVDQLQSIRELAAAMAAGQVDTLLIIGGNPVYTAPADLQFAEQMNKVRMRVHLSLHANETSAISHWQIPEAHFLEAWSDARAFDGTVSIVQPLIAPLYGGRSAHEVLATLSDRPERVGIPDRSRVLATTRARCEHGCGSRCDSARCASAGRASSPAHGPPLPIPNSKPSGGAPSTTA